MNNFFCFNIFFFKILIFLSLEPSSTFIKDAEIAMVSLGNKPQQASRAISQVLKNNPEIDDSEELIRFSLKSMI